MADFRYKFIWVKREYTAPDTAPSIEEIELLSDSGAITIDRFDEELDTSLLVIPYTSRREVYTRLDDVTIEIHQGGIVKKKYYVISKDDVTQVSKDPVLYTHEIHLIERTKKLERFLTSTLTFTQPTDGSVRYTLADVLERIRVTTPFESVANLDNTRLFTIDPELYAKLDEIEAPQLTLDRLSVREALNVALTYVYAISRLTEDNVLSADFFNYLNKLIQYQNVLHYEDMVDLDYYATSLESHVQNAVMEDNPEQSSLFTPVESGYMGIKGDRFLDSADAYFELPKPIWLILEAKTLVPIRVQYFENELVQEKNFVVQYPIGRYILPDKQHKLLPNMADFPNLSVQNTMRYQIGGTRIDLVYENWQGFLTDFSIWYYIFQSIQVELNNDFSKLPEFDYFGEPLPELDPMTDTVLIQGQGVLENYPNAIINISYIPIPTSMRIRLQREDLEDINKETQVLSNQQERLVSLDYYTKNLGGQIQRVGTDELSLSVVHYNINDLVEMGDYLRTDPNSPGFYVCVIAEWTLFNDYIIGKYSFSKNFNRISQYIGVNSEIRQYEIPQTSEQTETRNLIYEEFVEVGKEEITNLPDNAFVTTTGKRVFMNCLEYDPSYDKPLISCGFRPMDSELPYASGDKSGKSLLASTTGNSADNSLIFHWTMLDNQLAGNQIEPLGGGRFAMREVRYVKGDGSLDTFEFDLGYRTNARNFPHGGVWTGLLENEFIAERTKAWNLPIIDNLTGSETLIDSPIMRVWKDPRELLQMTYQLHVLPTREQYGKIIIGRELTRNNNLVNLYREDNPVKNNGLFVWGSTSEAYGKFDNLRVKETSVLFTSDGTTSGTRTIDYDVDFIVIGTRAFLSIELEPGTPFDILKDYRSIAIADGDGNLYLGINREEVEDGVYDDTPDIINFRFRNKRTGVLHSGQY
jgi:hypothetical protein